MKALANEFSRLLHEELGEETMREVIKRNEEYLPEICATHDFCDANMIMAEAFFNVTGEEIEPFFSGGTEEWGKAWKLAKNNKFEQT